MLKAVVGAASLAWAAAFAPMPSGLNLAAAHRPAVCGLVLRHGGSSLRMANANEDEMEELLKKRVELLKEQEELLKERKAIANRNTQSNDSQVPELQRPKEPPMAAKRADDLFKSVPSGNIFEGGDKKADEDGKRGAKQDGKGVFSRGGFLRTLVVSFGFSVLTLVSAFVLSYPRLEKLAYVQFGALFENGSIILRKQLYQAIEGEDWDAVMKLTDEGGVLEEQLLQPMLFWASTSVEDPNDLKEGGSGSYVAAVQATMTGAQASIDLIYDAAANKDQAKARTGWGQLKSTANAFVRLANQRMPDDSSPLSEIK